MSLPKKYQQQQFLYHTIKQAHTPTNPMCLYTIKQTSDEQQCGMMTQSTNNENETQSLEIACEPVYVTESDGKSMLMYDSSMMKEGKRYFVMWNGDPLALVKDGDNIIIYEGEIIS